MSGTDGVGTKLKLAFQLNKHDTVGQDLVAMSVNDILVQGAEPLFFLDYFACGRLDVETAATVVEGIARGCELAGCALIGGETAEMPSMYPDGEYDLAGFAVGAVEKSAIIDGTTIRPGDVVLGLASSGAHSNGYSLVRKILERARPDVNADFDGRPLRDALMAPTRIYVKSLLALMQALPVKGMAHITGGGLVDNVPRVLPENVTAILDQKSWPLPPLFQWLREKEGNVPMARCIACLQLRHGGGSCLWPMPTVLSPFFPMRAKPSIALAALKRGRRDKRRRSWCSGGNLSSRAFTNRYQP